MDAVGRIGTLTVPTQLGQVCGYIIAVPDTAVELAEDQQRAAALRVRGAELANTAGVQAIGLGNALAVVAGRGTDLESAVDTPVTTGHACTAWTCSMITKAAMEKHSLSGSRVGIIGFKGTVGDAVAMMLRQAHIEFGFQLPGVQRKEQKS